MRKGSKIFTKDFLLPLAPQMHRALKEESDRRGVSMCEIVRGAVARELRRSHLARERAARECAA